MEAGSVSVSITADASQVKSAADSAVSSLREVKSAVEDIPASYQTAITAVDRATGVINSIKSAISSIPSSKTVTVRVAQSGTIPRLARGTGRASTGLAVINDERGIADPRELVVHNGFGYIFDGRDVPIMLSDNDRVYTAKDTKRIMSAAGIPHYASGKDTEESFMTPTQMMKFDFSMGFINEEEYYRRIAEYRDSAYTQWSEDYNKLTLELKEYSDELLKREQENAEAAAKAGAEVYEQWEKSASNWKAQRDTYGDWEEYGDSAVDFYERCIERVNEFFQEGLIDYQTYCDDTLSYRLKLYEAEEEALSAIFDAQKSYINEISSDYDDKISSLKLSWESADRSASIAEIRGQMSEYSGAVTNKGISYYNQLAEQLKQLEREEELAALELEQKEALDALNESYDTVERNKTELLNGLLDIGADISEAVAALLSNTSALNSFFSTVSNITDNRATTNNSVSINTNGSVELNYFLRQALNL